MDSQIIWRLAEGWTKALSGRSGVGTLIYQANWRSCLIWSPGRRTSRRQVTISHIHGNKKGYWDLLTVKNYFKNIFDPWRIFIASCWWNSTKVYCNVLVVLSLVLTIYDTGLIILPAWRTWMTARIIQNICVVASIAPKNTNIQRCWIIYALGSHVPI